MSDGQEKVIRVGSRKSELALIQTKHVISLLKNLFPTKKFEIHTMSTVGDRVLNISLPKIGEKSLFTKDLEDALQNGGVDFVVHSLKDLPTVLPAGMVVGAILEREDPGDALVLRKNLEGCTLQTLPKGSIIGTSSLRRTAQLRRMFPHLVICDIRGNLNTRLAKLDAEDSKFSGIILAQAGLVRMGWMSRVSQLLEPCDLLYAVGQGALAVECRADDTDTLEMLRQLVCISTLCRILAERSFLKTLDGGCSAPVAVRSRLSDDCALLSADSNKEVELSLDGAVWSLDGEVEIRDNRSCVLKTKRKISENSTEESSSSADAPLQKRLRLESGSDQNNISKDSTTQHSPPIINDDIELKLIPQNVNIEQLIEKHIDLAKKCPIIGAELQERNKAEANGATIQRGGGDADTINDLKGDAQCPLQIEIGQDFMGECPFVNTETKAALANIGKCPITSHKETTANGKDQTDRATTSSKCPFNKHTLKEQETSNEVKEPIESTKDFPHNKCPFLHNKIEIVNYNEEKPLNQINKIDIALAETIENLFCGIYPHACYDHELFVVSNNLGRQLAEDLIRKGALDVMKKAKAEIHGKIL